MTGGPSEHRGVAFIYQGDPSGRDLAHVASAGRLVALATSLRAAGGDASIVAVAAPDAPVPDTIGGLQVHHLHRRADRSTRNAELLGTPSWAAGLSARARDEGIGAFALYGTSLRYSRPVHRAATRAGVRCFSIVNEWGNREVGLVSYLATKAGIAYTARHYAGAVVITTYMAERLEPRGLPTTVIPSLFDVAGFPLPCLEPPPSEHVTVAYAGSVANKKDHTHTVVEALADLPEHVRAQFRLHIVGATEADLAANIGADGQRVLARCSSSLVFHDFMERPQLHELLRTMDHTILIRPPAPYAMAGFPTKFAESMLLGVPPIANLTSDIGTYLHHGDNGVVVDGWGVDDVRASLEYVLALHQRGEGARLRRHARETGEEHFGTASHGHQLKTFIENPAP